VVVVPSIQFKAEDTLKSIHSEKPAVIVGNESQYKELLSFASLKRYNLSSIQKAVLGNFKYYNFSNIDLVGQPASSPVSQQITSVLGIKTVIPYEAK
jgi:hypothetical protein